MTAIDESSISGSMFWKLLEKFGSQIVQLVVSVIIARILDPDQYGTVAMITVFIQIATVFVQSGLSSALIQKQDVDEEERSSVFFFSLGMAIVLYAILYTCSGFIARFYEMPDLEILLKIQALVLFPGAINSLQISILSKRMEFRKQFFATLIAVSLSGTAGIFLAVSGFGAWSLVSQQLINQVVVCLVLWKLVAWRPKLLFSYSKTKTLLAFGIKLLAANIIDTLYHNLESLIIGKRFSADVLAYYDKGKQFPMILINNIDGSIQSVMFPAFSNSQKRSLELTTLLHRTISLGTYLSFPLMAGFAVCAKSIIVLVLGEKWLPAVPFAWLYCALAVFIPLQTACLQILNAVGRSDYYLKLIMWKRIVGLFFLFIATMEFDTVYSIVVAAIIAEIVGVFLNVMPIGKIIEYSVNNLIEDCAQNFIMSIVMMLMMLLCGKLGLDHLGLLSVQIIVGISSYYLLSLATKNDNLKYLRGMIMGLLSRHTNSRKDKQKNEY